MNYLKRFFDFILFGNIYIALGAVCLIQSTAIQLGINNNLFFYSILSFFATLFIYNFQRIFYSNKSDLRLHSIRRKWIFKNQNLIKVLTFIGCLGVFTSLFFNELKIIFYLSPLFILSIAYFAPFIKLRKNPWFKLIILAVVWTMVTAVVPILLCYSDPFTTNNLTHILVRFVFMIGICIPFDIRDLEIDKAENVFTFSQKFGEKKTRYIAFCFTIVYSILILIEYVFGMILLNVFIALIITAIINSIVVFMSNAKRNEYFFVFLLDGTMVFQGVIFIAFQLFCK